jgi:RNA-directed DNA polymerase
VYRSCYIAVGTYVPSSRSDCYWAVIALKARSVTPCPDSNVPEPRLLQASDDDLRAKLATLQSRTDVAGMLEVSLSRLAFHLYRVPNVKRYTTFEIKKKSGGTRTIRAPISALKILQGKLAYVLALVYQPKSGAHGFITGRSIVTNAQRHAKAKFVLNLDLKDFFPSINFGRVRGMLMAVPYNLESNAATILAQLCCVENALPQGAPTSPVVSNMICARLDSQLRSLAKKHHCVCTRYADDITFSTSLNKFPRPIAHYTPTSTGEELVLGAELQQVLDTNGFGLNPDKDVGDEPSLFQFKEN